MSAPTHFTKLRRIVRGALPSIPDTTGIKRTLREPAIMTSPWTKTAALLDMCGGLAACGGGGSAGEEPVNIDYSALRVASSHEGALSYATSDEQLLRALRNGLRMSLVGAPQVTAVADITAPTARPQGTFSA